jgi:tetratricopeptide (TPR) repeat protein
LYTAPQPIAILNPHYALAVGTVGVFVGAVLYFRRNPWVVFAALYFFLSIFFLLRISDVTQNLGPSIVADRFMYLPSLGFCFLAGWVLDQTIGRRDFLKVVSAAAAIVLIFGWQSHRQVLVWNNSLGFWNTVIQKNPSNAVAFLDRGAVLGQLQQYQAALQDFNRAIELKGNYIEAFNNRGNIYGALGDHRRAVEDYTTAIHLQKAVCAQTGCAGENLLRGVSSKLFQEIPKYHVQLANYYSNRGGAYHALDDFKHAVEDCRTAQQLNPYLLEAYFNCGLAYKSLNELPAAIKNFNRVIAMNPRATGAYFQRVSIYYQWNDGPNALADLDRILSFDPANAQAHYFKSKVYAAQGRFLPALESLSKAKAYGFNVSEAEFAQLNAAIKK